MELYLLRHGQSMWQTGESESKDSPLTPLGILQAQYLSNHLLESENTLLRKAHIISSPQKRSLQTTEELNVEHDIDERLQEAPFHVAEYLPEFDKPHLYEREYSHKVRYKSFKEEIKNCLIEYLSEGKNNQVVLYTHGGVIKTILRIIHDNDAICYTINNCSVTYLSWFRSRWHIKILNDVSFLPYDLIT